MPPRRPPPPLPPGRVVPRLALDVPLPAALAFFASALAAAALVSALGAAGLARRAWDASPALAASAAQAALSAQLVGPGRDWALASAGGRVVAHSPLEPGTPAAQAMPAPPRGSSTPPPVHPRADAWLLTPPPGGLALPGACLPLAGASGGWVDVRLGGSADASPPHVTGLSVDAPPAGTAWPDGLAGLPAVLGVALSEKGDGSDWVEAGEVEVPRPGAGASPPAVLAVRSPGRARVVRVRVVRNRGRAGGTCLHRVRVVGEE